MRGIVASRVQVSPLSRAEYLTRGGRDMGVEVRRLWNVSRCRGTCPAEFHGHRSNSRRLPPFYLSHRGYIIRRISGKVCRRCDFDATSFHFPHSLEKQSKDGWWGMTGRVIAVLLSAPSPLTPSATPSRACWNRHARPNQFNVKVTPLGNCTGSALASHAMTSWFASKFIFNASCKCHEPMRVHDWWVVDRVRCMVMPFFVSD